jgi:hypothetical protein
MTPTSPPSKEVAIWPSREVVAREIRRAMLDNPTDESFNKRAEKREAIANDVADVILARFEAALRSVQPPGEGVACSTCDGTEEVDERLGGSPLSGLPTRCPDCAPPTRPPSLVDREAVARIVNPGAFEPRYIEMYPDRSTLEGFEAYQKADAILSLVNPQDKGAGCTFPDCECANGSPGVCVVMAGTTAERGADGEDVRKVLAPFYKTVDVMKSARNSPTHTMHVWADDMKAVEDVMSFLEAIRDESGRAALTAPDTGRVQRDT